MTSKESVNKFLEPQKNQLGTATRNESIRSRRHSSIDFNPHHLIINISDRSNSVLGDFRCGFWWFLEYIFYRIYFYF
ncbi:hypothetical protein V6Z11_A10G190300 [Gossypium hirsutum]